MISLCKVCDPNDWPELETSLNALGAPQEKHKKYWEWAIGLESMMRLGKLSRTSKALGIGVGWEWPSFWLSNKIGHVYASDLWTGAAKQHGCIGGPLLEQIKNHTPFPYDRYRLTWVEMDGTDLTFEDNSFDIVYSYSSIEHFGSKEAAEKCMREVARVLKPGGMASIATELILGVYHDLKWEFLKSIQNMLSSHWLEPELFTPEQLNLLISMSGLKPTNPLHLSVANIDPFYGGIYMKGRGFYWTSVHLCLVKPE